MPTFKDLERIVGRTVNERQPMRGKFRALIGHPDGETIDVDENPGYVFVRINGRADAVRQALCRAVLPRYNQPVIVAYNDELPNTLEVAGLDTNGFPPGYGGGSSWDGFAQLGRHANQHFLAGGDTVYVQSKQIMPLRARAINPATMEIYVEAGAYQYQAGFNYWGGGRSADFTAQIPSTVDTALYRLVYIDATTNALAYANTAEIQSDTFSADIDAILALFPTISVPIAAVRLYYGQTSITETDVFDLRSFVSSAPGTVMGNIGWQNVLVVSPTGAEYTSPSAALTAITDASSSNRYIVFVMPGIYAGFTAKPYVSIIGLSRKDCIITPVSGPANAITIPTTAGDYYIAHLSIQTGVGDSGIVMTGSASGIVLVDDCEIISPNAVTMASTDAAGSMTLRDCDISGGGSGVLIGNSQNGHLTLIDCTAISSGIYCIQQVTGSPVLIISGGYFQGATDALEWCNTSTNTFRNFPILSGLVVGSGGSTTMTGSYMDANNDMIVQAGDLIDGVDVSALAAGSVSGSGTIGNVAQFTGATTIGDAPLIMSITAGKTITLAATLASSRIYSIPDYAGVWIPVEGAGSGVTGYVTYYGGDHKLTGDAAFTYSSSTHALTTTGIIKTKAIGLAGIQLDRNAATGDFTLSLSPANLTADRRVTFGDVGGTAALGADTLTVSSANDVTVASHTHAITSSSNPGAAASILASTAAGLLTLVNLNLSATSNQIVIQSAGVTGTLTWTPATSNKVITLPNLTGTMTLGAGTLTVATANSVTVADHTHAITSSAAPGATASILATTAAGLLTLENLNTTGIVGFGVAGATYQVLVQGAIITGVTTVDGMVIRDSAAERLRLGYANVTAPIDNIVPVQILDATVESSGGLILATRGSVAAGMAFWTSSGGAGNLVERMRISSGGSVIISAAALATNATAGFLYIPTCAGTPTGTPTTFTGRVPIVFDTTNGKLYIYTGGAWKGGTVPGVWV